MGAPRGPKHFFSIMILKHEQNTIIWSKKVFSSIARLLLVICKYAKMSHNAPPHPTLVMLIRCVARNFFEIGWAQPAQPAYQLKTYKNG